MTRPAGVRSRILRSPKHSARRCGTVRARHLGQHCWMNGKYSTCLLRHRRVVVSQRWNHIASFLRLALAQNSGTVFTVHPATLYQFALAFRQQLKVPLGFAPVLFSRMLRASKYSSKDTCRARQSPFPAGFRKFYSKYNRFLHSTWGHLIDSF